MSELEDLFRSTSTITFESTWREVSDRLKKEPIFEALLPEVQCMVMFFFARDMSLLVFFFFSFSRLSGSIVSLRRLSTRFERA